jgi:Mce-associated membrane protein
VTGAILGLQYRDAVRTDNARTAAMAAAEKAAPVIFSYDYRHLDQDFAKAEALLTGSFRDQYAKTTQTVVKPTALQYQGVVQAVVAKPANGGAPAVSVVSASPDQVVVLAFIDQSTTSTRVNGTQVDQNRVLLTLTNTPKGWLVSGVDAL